MKPLFNKPVSRCENIPPTDVRSNKTVAEPTCFEFVVVVVVVKLVYDQSFTERLTERN